MTVRSQIHASLSRHLKSSNFAHKFSAKDAWALIEPEKLTPTADSLRVHLNKLCKEGKITRTTHRVTGDHGTHSRVFYSLQPRVEEEESNAKQVNLPIPAPPEPAEVDEAAKDDLGDFFRMIRDALRERDIVAFSVTEAGDIEYEQRIVRKRSLSLT